MKKKYTKCRLGLLIGLLSLNTLSSCVKTGQLLGMGPGISKDGKNNNVEEGRNKNSSNNSNNWSVKKVATGLAFVGAAGAAGYVGYEAGRSSAYGKGYADGNKSCSNWSSNNNSYSNFSQAESKWNSTAKGAMDLGDPYGKRKK